jgi:uncharacterized protein (DUF169 family)
MTTQPVGVTLVREGVGRGEEKATETAAEKESFCRYVHEAAAGKSYLIQPSQQACNKAEIALGLRAPRFGNIEPRIKSKINAVRIGPLAGADVVLLVLNPEQAMTLAHLLPEIEMSFKNNRTVCGEGVARVCQDGQAVMSLLCIGARMDGGFKADEMLAALPHATFVQLPARMNKLRSISRQAVDSLKDRLTRLNRAGDQP